MHLLPKQHLAFFCLLTILSIQKAFAQNNGDYNIIQYGAVADGKQVNTSSIQKAIDAANDKGGGRVIVPAGKFITGTLELKSNVTLYLEKNAELLGSTNPTDYRALKMPGMPESPKQDDLPQKALLSAYMATNIALEGAGTIDGQGTALALTIDSLHLNDIVIDPHYSVGVNRPNERVRPKLIGFALCKNVLLSGLYFKSSSCWGLNFELCNKLSINGIHVTNRAYWNNDGMDITDCKNVSVTNCNVNAADDGICLKSYYPGHSNDSVYIANCTIVSGASAIKFGTASYGGFKNINIENIKIFDTYRSAIAIESVDGGVIENVKVEHISAKNTGNAIFIRLGHRAGVADGIVKNIYLHDIKVQVPFERADINYDIRAEEPGYHNPFPSSITGIPGHPVENVVLDDIEVTFPGRASKAQAYYPLSRLGKLPEHIKDYPEFSMFGELPAWALYIRHTEGIELKNIKLKLDKDDFRPAIVLDDVKKVNFSNIALPVSGLKKQVILKDVTDSHFDETIKYLIGPVQ